MAEIAQSMVKDSIDAFMRDDTDLADQVIARDDEVDLLNYQVYRELLSYMARIRIRSRRRRGCCSSRSTWNGSPITRPISRRW